MNEKLQIKKLVIVISLISLIGICIVLMKIQISNFKPKVTIRQDGGWCIVHDNQIDKDVFWSLNITETIEWAMNHTKGR